MERQPNTIYVACISHGKDSNAMLHVIKDVLHYPLDRIITTDVWFDDNLRAELPPMVEWKDKADKIILEKWGIPVEHLCAMRGGQRDSYTRTFCRQLTRGKFVGNIKGFPQTTAGWCKKLKYEQIDIPRYILQTYKRTDCERERERERVHRLRKQVGVVLQQLSQTRTIRFMGSQLSATDIAQGNSRTSTSFLISPKNEGLKQISFSTLGLLMTNLNG